MDIRRNPLTGVPVVVAPGRSTRPGALGRTTRIADAATCPFCEGHEAMTPPEVLALGRAGGGPDTPGWTVRVVPNKFPAIPGQEVVVHGPEHVTAFAELPAGGRRPPHSRPGTRAAATSRGSRAGRPTCWRRSTRARPPGPRSTTPTPSSCRSPTIPPAVAAEMPAFAAPCALCAAAAGEDDAHGPTRRRPAHVRPGLEPVRLRALDRARGARRHPADPEALAAALLDATRRLRAVLGDELAWNAVLHAAPLRGGDPYHWHVEIWPRLTVAASVELGAGVWVNIVDPRRRCARELRSVVSC